MALLTYTDISPPQPIEYTDRKTPIWPIVIRWDKSTAMTPSQPVSPRAIPLSPAGLVFSKALHGASTQLECPTTSLKVRRISSALPRLANKPSSPSASPMESDIPSSSSPFLEAQQGLRSQTVFKFPLLNIPLHNALSSAGCKGRAGISSRKPICETRSASEAQKTANNISSTIPSLLPPNRPRVPQSEDTSQPKLPPRQQPCKPPQLSLSPSDAIPSPTPWPLDGKRPTKRRTVNCRVITSRWQNENYKFPCLRSSCQTCLIHHVRQYDSVEDFPATRLASVATQWSKSLITPKSCLMMAPHLPVIVGFNPQARFLTARSRSYVSNEPDIGDPTSESGDDMYPYVVRQRRMLKLRFVRKKAFQKLIKGWDKSGPSPESHSVRGWPGLQSRKNSITLKLLKRSRLHRRLVLKYLSKAVMEHKELRKRRNGEKKLFLKIKRGELSAEWK